jgi:dinuclear metal center YbgI/SA1388 family protein
MSTVQTLCEWLERFAPTSLAEEWDNVGLLVGDRGANVERVMTCLTLTPDSVDEAVAGRADLVVTHHPLPFRPLKRVTSDTVAGRLLLRLIQAGVAVYSPHTAFDSARGGINGQLASGLGLSDVLPLVAADDERHAQLGAGRYGRTATSVALDALAEHVKQFLAIDRVRVVGPADRPIEKVALACGSGGEFLSAARRLGCDCLVTGETNFHSCLEAESTGVALVLTGHFASERFALETLAADMQQHFPDAQIWASRQEHDPLRVV